MRNLLPVLALLACAIIWGSTMFIIKGAVLHVDPLVLVAWRFLLAAVLLAGIVLCQRKKLFSKEGVVLGVMLIGVYVPQAVGLLSTTAAKAGFLTGLFILFVPIFDYALFRRVPKAQKIASVMICLCGLWILTGMASDFTIGDLLMLVSAATYCLHVIYTERYVKKSDLLALVFQQFLVVALACFALAALLGRQMSVPSVSVPSLVYLALLPTVIAFLLQAWAQKKMSAIAVALLLTLDPVFAAVFAWTLGGEQFIALQAAGGLIIVVGMLVAEIDISALRHVMRPNRP